MFVGCSRYCDTAVVRHVCVVFYSNDGGIVLDRGRLVFDRCFSAFNS